ncbi:MAG TPA: GNAT family N-acetyltransferase [Streptosporangiaceae bacterium]|jgi:RimJ/RimL family protein N-acetyltransferase
MNFDSGVILTTKRLTLRPFEEDDAADVAEAVKDAEIRRWMAWAPDHTPAQARDWCMVHAHAGPEDQVNFAIVANGRCSGAIGLNRVSWSTGRVEIGYWVAPWARRRGYAVEATSAVAAYAFEKGLHRVELLAATGNAPSQRVAERAGFTREGVLREVLVVPGGRADGVLFSLLRGDLR